MMPSVSMDKKLVLAMITIRFIYAGIHIITKAAFTGGMNTFVFVFYRQAAATVLLTPIALVFERKKAPSAPFAVYVKMFLLSLCGIGISLNTSSLAIKFTSASLSAATENTIPVITFILVVLLRMEVVNLRRFSGIAKAMGVAFFLGGIMTIAFYRGPLLRSLNHHHLFGKDMTTAAHHGSSSSTRKWMMGCFLMVIANTEWCLWLVLQGSLLKKFPSKLLFTTLQVAFSALQAFVIALIAARDFSQWKLGFDVDLLSVLYCGILVTGVSFYLQTWCIERAGPILLATTTPLTLIITMLCLTFILGEAVELGSVIGGILMVIGLYSVLLGKSSEESEGSSSGGNGSTAADDKEWHQAKDSNDASLPKCPSSGFIEP